MKLEAVLANKGKVVGLIHTPGSRVSVSLRNVNDVVTHYRVSVWLIEGF